MKELVLYAGTDYEWRWTKPEDGSTPQLVMFVKGTGMEKIVTVFGAARAVSMTHEQGTPERVTVRPR